MRACVRACVCMYVCLIFPLLGGLGAHLTISARSGLPIVSEYTTLSVSNILGGLSSWEAMLDFRQ